MSTCDICIEETDSKVCDGCQDDAWETAESLGFGAGLVWGAAIVAMFQAIRDRYENCWHCGEPNERYEDDTDRCTRCGAVLAYA